MIGLLQRVREARVEVAGEVVGQIGPGLLALVCAEQGDGQPQADKLLAKMLKLRIFADAAGKMNLSLQDMDGAEPAAACSSSASSPWPPTRAAATARAFPRPRYPPRASACTTTSSPRRARRTRWSPPAALPPTCRCTWSTTGR